MRFQLKQRTAIAHERLDTAISGLSLAHRPSYGIFLGTHQLAYRSLLRSLPDDHWLVEVLRDGVCELAADLDTLDVHVANPDLFRFGKRLHPLGAAYVVTGSHFGKKILARRWSASTDPQVKAAGAFLTSDRLGRGWKRFMVELDEMPQTGPVVNAVADDAGRVFTLFHDSLRAIAGLEHMNAGA